MTAPTRPTTPATIGAAPLWTIDSVATSQVAPAGISVVLVTVLVATTCSLYTVDVGAATSRMLVLNRVTMAGVSYIVCGATVEMLYSVAVEV